VTSVSRPVASRKSRVTKPNVEATVMIPTPVAGVAVQTGVDIVSDWWRRWTRHPRWVAAAGALGALAVVAALALGRGRGEAARAAAQAAKHDSAVAAAPVAQAPARVESTGDRDVRTPQPWPCRCRRRCCASPRLRRRRSPWTEGSLGTATGVARGSPRASIA